MRNQGRKFHEKVTLTESVIWLGPLSFLESLLKVGPLISNLMPPSCIAYYLKSAELFIPLRNTWNLGMFSSGLEFETRAFRI
jgi:hypothetical protein